MMKQLAVPCVFFSVAILFGSGPLFARNSGFTDFEKAYQIESIDPGEAIRLYREAIKEGLDSKLLLAARWKLFYLYKETKDYTNALLLLNSFGSGKRIQSVKESLIEDIQYEFGIPQNAADEYANGLVSLATGSEEFRQPFAEAIKSAPHNRRLKAEIIHQLNRAGKRQEASEILAMSAESPIDSMLQRIDLLVGEKKYDKAEEMLSGLSDYANALTPEQKEKILYLFGKISKMKGELENAVSYYRLAAFYSKKSNVRYLSLAAFILYQNGYPLQAHALMRPVPATVADPNIRLLHLILKIEVENDDESWDQLISLRPVLLRDNSYLSQRALELLDRGEER